MHSFMQDLIRVDQKFKLFKKKKKIVIHQLQSIAVISLSELNGLR